MAATVDPRLAGGPRAGQRAGRARNSRRPTAAERRAAAPEPQAGLTVAQAGTAGTAGIQPGTAGAAGAVPSVVSRLKLSPSPTLIFEVDAAERGDDGHRARRCEVRLVGSIPGRKSDGADGGGDATAGSEMSAVLLIRALSPPRMLQFVRAVTRGGASVPPELLAELIPEADHHPEGFRPEELTGRELAVVRMLADGLTTREIAEALSYSERTVKNIVHDLLEKLGCRTRAHAVALATRHGVI